MLSNLTSWDGKWSDGVCYGREMAPCGTRPDENPSPCVNCRLPCPMLYGPDADERLDEAPCLRRGRICQVCLKPCPYLDPEGGST